MILISFFLATVLLFSLISRRMEKSIITAPMVFTIAGMVGMFVVAESGEFQMERNLFSTLAEIGLVMTLFVDATHVNRKNLEDNYKLPLRLLGIGMLPTILLGAVFASVLFPKFIYLGSRSRRCDSCADRRRVGTSHSEQPKSSAAHSPCP